MLQALRSILQRRVRRGGEPGDEEAGDRQSSGRMLRSTRRFETAGASSSLPAPPSPTFGRDEDVQSALEHARERRATSSRSLGPGASGRPAWPSRSPVSGGRAGRAGRVDFVDSVGGAWTTDVVAARIADQLEPRRACCTATQRDDRGGSLSAVAASWCWTTWSRSSGAANDVASLARDARRRCACIATSQVRRCGSGSRRCNPLAALAARPRVGTRPVLRPWPCSASAPTLGRGSQPVVTVADETGGA